MTAQSLQIGPGIFPGRHSEERDWLALGSRRYVDSRSGLAAGMSQTKPSNLPRRCPLIKVLQIVESEVRAPWLDKTTAVIKRFHGLIIGMNIMLLFNEAIPASTRNRATWVGPPAPIVIERLMPVSEVPENVDSTRSSFSFTTLSEERLQAAVKLAKRDLRQRRLESLTKTSAKPSQEASLFETSDVELLQELAVTPSKMKSKASSPKEKVTQAGAKRHLFQKHPIPPMPRMGRSPPTRDPGYRQVEGGKEAPLSHEIHKLQNELEVYIQKVEELANRAEEKIEEPLEPEEQNKLEIRRQKQAARSARIIYVLQQQVKEIQEDIGKLRNQNVRDTKKSMAINRLAAAHRGALRALQVFIHQLSDLSHSKVPPYSKELGQLIRQLSLCSAKIEVNQGSAVPETALDILQKLETLDSALSKQEMLKKVQAQACPQQRKSPHRSMSPAPRGPKLQGAVRVPCKPKNPRRGMRDKRVASQKPKTTQQPINRREVLRTGLESLAQQRELQELQRGLQTNTKSRKGLPSERKKAETMKHNQMQDAGFQQPTVSSRLRVNQLPQKENSVPWIPTSPHSPPPQRSPQRGRPEPRCLFSPVKLSSISTNPPNSPKQRVGGGFDAELGLSSQKKNEAQNEALRKAWLDKMTAQRLKELNQLSKEETERIQRLRSEVVSPTQWAERAEQKARERIQPLLDEAEQIGESRNRINSPLRSRVPEQAAEELSEELLDDLQAPTLESMLLRMEEIQRDQEEVRRRFASITYSDPLYWERPGASGSQSHSLGSRPASPQPIRLTRPVLKQTSAVAIVLEKPVETGFLCENSLTEEASQDDQHPANNTMFPGPVGGSKGTVISVPGSMLRNIRRYRADHEAYLRAAAHEAVGGFNPWAIADSLADELLSEALADVAAEFQDVVEEYAEAVFTSEFLQPIRSPSASAAALAGQ